jgi:DnaJ-class molecular chaperone
MILLLAFTARAVVDRTFYDLLGLNITANEGQVKDAYKIQSRKMHPDRVRTDDREAAQ